MPSGNQQLITDIFKSISRISTNAPTLLPPPPTNTSTSSTPSTTNKPVQVKRFRQIRIRATRKKPNAPRNPYTPKQKKPNRPLAHQHQINSSRPSDNTWIGNKIYKKKSNVARFWVQNRNGINRHNHFKHFAEEIVALNSIDPQFIAFTETNLNANNTYVHDQISSVIEEVTPGSQFVLSSTSTAHSSETLQYGGLISIAQGNLAMRIASKGSDRFGRYQWIHFFGKKTHLKVYNIYRPVNHTDNSSGDGTVWSQHREILLKHNIQTNPRKHILDSLLPEIAEDQRMNRQILIFGDFNEDVFGVSLNEFFERAGLINLIQQHISPDDSARSYFRGKHVIDGCWASPQVAQYTTAVGLAPFYYIIPSDHRGTFIDINIHELLDDYNPLFIPPPYRRLKSSIPKRVKRYCEEISYRWFLYNITEKINKLEFLFQQDGPTPNNIASLNNLDLQIQEIMSCSEKKCCKIGRHANISWSAAFGRALKKERHLKCQLNREALKSSFKYSTPTIKKIIADLRATRREMTTIRTDDVSFRDSHLDACAEQAVIDNPQLKKDGVIKQLKNIEKQIRESSRVGRTLNGMRTGALTHVLIPARSEYASDLLTLDFDHTDMQNIWNRVNTKENGKDVNNWDIIDRKEKVEELTLHCMQLHFQQANGTPMTEPPWINKLTSERFQKEIIDGTFDTSSLPPPIRLYLNALERPNAVKKELEFKYSFHEFCSFVRKSKEKTSASPSGRHYGHYIVLLKKLPGLLEDIYRVMNISITHGVILERFLKTVTTLICKEDLPYIHRLRPIHIIEVELQAISKSQWAKKLIHNAEKLELITDSQYGARKNRQPQSLILNKTLTYDINRHTAQNFTSVDEDLKACYDRELSCLGALEDRYYGNSYQHGSFLTQTTTGMKFFVKTSFGTSEKNYSYSDNKRIWGLGQGIGWSGARWTLTSSTISRVMDEECHGLRLRSPDNSVFIKQILAQFVDDLATICNYSPSTSIVNQTNHNIQLHADLVNVTGGMLALDKCKMYLCEFYFDDDGDARIYRMKDRPCAINVKDPLSGKMVPLRQLDPSTPHKNLGYLLVPDGDQSAMFEMILEYVQNWQSKITNSFLWPHEIILSYRSTLVPQIRYRLAATSLSYEQCDFMMKLIYPKLLHASHLPSTFPRSIASAPFTYAGLGWDHIYDIQGKEKLHFLLMHMRREDTTGQMMFIALQYMQQSIGCEREFYDLDYTTYEQYLPPSWMKHLCEYIHSRGVSFELTKKIGFKPQRMHDQFLMDILTPHFTKSQLLHINKVRLHLKVLRLSDVTDVTGKYILPNIRRGINYRDSTYGWIRQPLVQKFLPLWSQACRKLQQSLDNRRLGRWINRSQSWKWNSNSSGTIISDNTTTYTRQTIRGRTKYILHSNRPSLLPYPADVDVFRDRPKLLGVLIEPVDVKATLKDIYKPFFEKHVLPKKLEKKIVKLIKKKRLVYGSDASVNEHFYGSFAWGIQDIKNENYTLIKSHAPVHGDVDQIHSTRGELFGILACLRHIHYLLDKYKFTVKKKIKIVTDSKSSIQIARSPMYVSYKNTFDDDADIKAEVRTLYKKLQNSVSLQHVKAHQDDQIPFKRLSRDSKLNVLMDTHAKLALTSKTTIKHRRLIPHLPHQKISLKSRYDRLTSNISNNINRYKIGHEAEQWLASRWKLTDQQMTNIAWNDLKHVLTNAKSTKQQQYTKIIHKMWSINARQYKWKQVTSPACPFCHETDETRTHLFQCPHPVSKTNRTTLLLNLRTHLQGIATSPLIVNHILRCLYQFHNGFEVTPINTALAKDITEKTQMNAINHQISFGIDNLLSGALTLQLASAQRHYSKNQHNGPKSKNINYNSWNRSFIKLILDYSNDLWLYRCKILHDDEKLTRESTVRAQAVTLLESLKKDPFQVPFSFRNLLNRSPHYLKTTHLRNVRNWLNRINFAVELEAGRRKNGVNDIRRWLTNEDKIEHDDSNSENNRNNKIAMVGTKVDNSTTLLTVVNNKNPVPN